MLSMSTTSRFIESRLHLWTDEILLEMKANVHSDSQLTSPLYLCLEDGPNIPALFLCCDCLLTAYKFKSYCVPEIRAALKKSSGVLLRKGCMLVYLICSFPLLGFHGFFLKIKTLYLKRIK